ncbi:hypothetical protein [Sphingomonas sp. LM7]|uniref:hypothetical protein n=1 Tax=Sphingomonas sp. LM7 TaxID=1938607 RepID=UPI0012372669|nr:hypothetical protein [Sphingomonas sp. LM7]
MHAPFRPTQPNMVPRRELWRRQYRANRYARHLSRVELNKRLRDLVLNMLTVTPEAKIGLLQMDRVGAELMEKWTHALEEMVQRYGPYPAGFDRDILHSEPFPDFASELAQKAADRMSKLELRKGEVFIKLGKRKYMEALFAAGQLRLQPGSFFSNPDHNQAVRDDEMSLPLSFMLTREQIIRLVQNPEDVPPNVTEQRLDIQFESGADFWLYCVTQSIDPRLFVDFNADACVVIRDRRKFSQRLLDKAKGRLGTTEARQGRANYVDPLLPKSPKIFVPLSKPFGYAYQDEFRFCWLPKPPVKQVGHVDLELGPLEDIAELIIL